MSKHFDMLSDKNIRHNEYTVEGSPFFLRYFYTMFHQIHQNVLKIRNFLLFLLHTSNVKPAVCYYLNINRITFLKM